jgi:RNA polymerase sigma-70 factor (ECF subfamily)
LQPTESISYYIDEAIKRVNGVDDVEDDEIVDLFWARSEIAIAETSRKYGQYCMAIALNILSNRRDAEESGGLFRLFLYDFQTMYARNN